MVSTAASASIQGQTLHFDSKLTKCTPLVVFSSACWCQEGRFCGMMFNVSELFLIRNRIAL